MYTALSPGAIGVHPADLEHAIASARLGGFDGLEFDVREVAALVDRHGAEHVRELFARAHVRPACWGLPTDWRGDDEAWRSSLEELPRLSRAAAAIGSTRTATWVLPYSDTRAFDENRRFHIDRFAPIVQILAEQGCSLGLEFVGPRTLREGKPYEFISTLDAMLQMSSEIGPNVGVLLDCYHWYTSGGTAAELHALRPEQVVLVHVNDAPAGIPVDAQLDAVRALPGETGVIDIVGFLQALQAIAYTGPVIPEPFKRELHDLPSDADRLRTVGAAMSTIFARAGLQSEDEGTRR